jgi:hypothetical protein
MHPEVDWPNAWEGGRVVGRAAVRDYWDRQFAVISSKVEPENFTEESDGSITVDVQQVVHDRRRSPDNIAAARMSCFRGGVLIPGIERSTRRRQRSRD